MSEETKKERLERERVERFIKHTETMADIRTRNVEKYEYLTECYDLSYFGSTSNDGTSFLNMNAQAGWELMQMLSVPVTDHNAQLSSHCLLAVYRRQVATDPI